MLDEIFEHTTSFLITNLLINIMESKTLNKKQGIGLFCVGIAVLIITIANKFIESYEWAMIGIAILLFAIGIFLVLKYRE